MKFMYPGGGVTDDRFGILTAPYHKGVPIGIVNGLEWMADPGVIDGPKWLKRFDPAVFFPWLNSMLPYRSTCRCIPCPDVYGDAKRTIEAYWYWSSHFTGWPLAFIAQDGQEHLDFPGDEWQVLFIGGSTFWKCSDGSVRCIKRAQALGKQIHIGRVNWPDRYRFFRRLEGSGEFTCDGTRATWDGRDKTLEAWRALMDEPKSELECWPVRLPIFGGNHDG